MRFCHAIFTILSILYFVMIFAFPEKIHAQSIGEIKEPLYLESAGSIDDIDVKILSGQYLSEEKEQLKTVRELFPIEANEVRKILFDKNWIFFPDGTFTKGIFLGSYRQIDGNILFQGESPIFPGSSIDGILRRQADDTFHIEVLYVGQISIPQRSGVPSIPLKYPVIATASDTLMRLSNIPESPQSPLLNSLEGTSPISDTARKDVESVLIKGFEVPSGYFNITLTDIKLTLTEKNSDQQSIAFSPEPSEYVFTLSNPLVDDWLDNSSKIPEDVSDIDFTSLPIENINDPEKLDVSLYPSTEDFASPGSFSFFASLNASEIENKTKILTASMDGDTLNVTLELTPESPIKNESVNISWQFISENVAEPIVGENCFVRASIKGNMIFGSIEATGSSLDLKRKSTYSARFQGQIQGAAANSTIAAIETASPFDGSWEVEQDFIVPNFGLKQQNETISMEFNNTKFIGHVTQNSAYIPYSYNVKKGWILLRPFSGIGILAGLRQEQFGDSYESSGFTAKRHVVHALHVQEILEKTELDTMDEINLKQFGQSLIETGKYEDALPIFEKLLSIYQEKREQKEQNLENEGFDTVSLALFDELRVYSYLAECYNGLADYPKLIETLTIQITLEAQSAPDQWAAREFEAKLASVFESLGVPYLLEVASESLSFLLSDQSGVIGISFELDEKTKQTRITQVEPESPAAQAGILVGDVIVMIDGQSVQGVSFDEVLSRLRGKANDPLSLVLRRNNKRVDITLIRGSRFIGMSPQRRERLIRAMSAFSEICNTLQTIFPNSEKDLLHKIELHCQAEKCSAYERLKAFPYTLADIRQEIPVIHKKLYEAYRASFQGQPEAMQKVEWATQLYCQFFPMMFPDFSLQDYFCQYLPDDKKDESLSMQELIELDTKIEQFWETTDTLTSLEKKLFSWYHILCVMLFTDDVNMHTSKESIERNLARTSYEERKKRHIESVQRLIPYLENWRKRLATDEDKIEALKAAEPFYQEAVTFLVQQNEPEQALVFAEAAKSRAFLDLLASKPQIQQELRKIVNDQQDTANELFVINPFTSTSEINSEKLKAIIKKRHSTTIEYFLTPEELIIWTITPSGEIRAFSQLIDRETFREKVTTLLEELESPSPDQNTVQFYLKTFYDLLVKPIPQELLPGHPNEVVTIIPHQELLQLPFGALLDEENRYFIEKHALAYSSSLTLLEYTMQNKEQSIRNDTPNLLALINPQPISDPDLPIFEYIKRNFDAVAQFYPDSDQNQLLIGSGATKQALRQNVSKYQVLCLAAHGTASDENPLDSYMYLARTEDDNGHLRIPDIFQLDLHSDLTILLGCQTGQGVISGDGVNGISRAFTWAGTPSLLMSLWPVPEESSLEQMYQFHRYWLEQGFSKAQALRLAQLHFIEEGYQDQPQIWAGFVLFGEAE